MKNMQWKATLLGTALACLSLVPQARAQHNLEVGALGLISDYRSVQVSNASSTGSVGPGLGFSGGFVIGQSMNNRWGGEFRYVYFKNDLELIGGGRSADFGAQSHAIHYDVLYYFNDPDSRIRPYAAAGVGMKHYQGTGTENSFQPLSDLALLTKAGETKPMGDFGVGVKFFVGKRMMFRVEFRDYITAVPGKVITAAPGAKIDGILHQWAPMFGFSYMF